MKENKCSGKFGVFISVICHFGLITCIVVIIFYQLNGGLPRGLIAAPIVFAVLAYLWILIEACCSTTMSYCRNSMTEGEVHEYIKKLKREPPVVTMHKTIPVYVNRTTAGRYSAWTGPITIKESVKANKPVSKCYIMDGWRDTSPELTGLSVDTPTRVTVL